MEKKNKILNELKKLSKIMDKNGIWYSLDAGTLLGAYRDGKMINWDDDVDLSIKYEGYKKLKKLYPNNILDNDDEGYPLLFPKWVDKKSGFDENSGIITIDLFIIVNTTYDKIKKYKSIKNKIRFSMQTLNKSKMRKFSFPLKILWIFQFFMFPFFWKKITIDDVFNSLKSNAYNCIKYMIVNPTIKNKVLKIELDELWTREKIKFENYEYSCYKNPHLTLINRYGPKYMTPSPGKYVFRHENAISVRKIKTKNIKLK